MADPIRPRARPLGWGDTHHPALSETAGQYDGRWLYINDRANGRIAMIDLADFKTKQIIDVPNLGTSHGGAFVTPNTEYAHISSITPRPTTANGYAPLERYADLYRGYSTWYFIDPKTGRLVPEKSFQIELPPYNQDLADAGKLASDGFGFINSFNTELAVGGTLDKARRSRSVRPRTTSTTSRSSTGRRRRRSSPRASSSCATACASSR